MREPAAMSVRSAATWMMASQYLVFALQFATSVIISRFFLAPSEVGLFSIALAVALLVSVLQDFGLSRYISGLPRLDAGEVARCSSIALLFSLAIAAIIAVLAAPMATFYHLPALKPILLVVALSYLFQPLSVVPMALMARTMQFRGHFTVAVCSAVAQCVVAVGLAAAGFSSFALAWATVAAAAVRALTAQTLRPAPPWPLRFDRIGAVLNFGARSSMIYITGALGTRTPDLIVGKALGVIAVGLYSRAVSLSDQFRMLIAGAIGSVMFPAFARIRDTGQPLGPAYLRVCAGFSAVLWPGMAGLALAGEPLVRLLYGPQWLGVAPLVSMIALAEILLTALPLVSEIPILMGRIDRLLMLNILDTVLSLALLAIGAGWGVEGVAASRIVYAGLWLLIYFRFMHHLVGFDRKHLGVTYLRSLIVTVAAIAPLLLTYLLWAGPAIIGFAALLAAVAAGGIAWLAALWLVRHPALDEMIAIASGVPGGKILQRLSR